VGNLKKDIETIMKFSQPHSVSFDEFLEKVLSLDISIDEQDSDRWRPYRTKTKNKRALIQITWETGGAEGVSCYDDSEPELYTIDKPYPELDSLKRIIREIAPDLKATEFFDFIDPLIQKKSWNKYDDYGNYTSYQAKYVYLDELYNKLVELNYINAARA
jgi:hypothetical protein